MFHLSLISRSCTRKAGQEELLDVPNPKSCSGLQEITAMALPCPILRDGPDPLSLPLCHASVPGCHIDPRSQSQPGALPTPPIPPFPTQMPLALGEDQSSPCAEQFALLPWCILSFGLYQKLPDMKCLKRQHQGDACKLLHQYPDLCQHL